MTERSRRKRSRGKRAQRGLGGALTRGGLGGVALASLAALSALGVHAYLYFRTGWMVDDAFIPFRYVHNLALGSGLVWNHGERVEGFSNPLWVALLVPIGGAPELLPAAAQLLAATTTVAAVVATILWARQEGVASSWGAGLLVAAAGPIAAWAVGGLETPLFGLLLLLTAWASARRPGRLRLLHGVPLALAILCRPEGIALWPLVAAYHIVRARGHLSTTWGPLARFHGLVASVVVAALAARLAYYGSPLPNTYFAKAAGTTHALARGAGYLFEAGLAHWALVALAVVGITRPPRGGQRALRGGLLLALAPLALTLWAGGDPLPAYRFLAPTVPLLAVAAAAGADALASPLGGWRRRLVAAAMVLVACGQLAWASARDEHNFLEVTVDRVAWRGRHVGELLRAELPPDTLVATNAAGALPFYSGLPTVDMLGLNDRTIARAEVEAAGSGYAGHERGDGAYVLGRRPGVILFCSSMGAPVPCFPSDRQLAESDEFRRLYRLVRVQAGPVPAHLWVREGLELDHGED